MRATLSPWKRGDQGYACMPLRHNIPSPEHSDWRLVNCPACGRECWESDLLRQVQAMGVKALCTECALRAGMGGEAK